MRIGQYSFSTKEKDVESRQLCEHYQIVSIQHGVTFSRLILNAMKAYKDAGSLPELKETSNERG